MTLVSGKRVNLVAGEHQSCAELEDIETSSLPQALIYEVCI